MSDGGLAPDALDWVERATGGVVVRADRHLAGASRQAFSIDVRRGDELLALFLLRDNLGSGGGSARDGAVLRALAGTAVPVPVVHAVSEELGALLLERVTGRSDFPVVDDEREREPTARHLMQLTAALHALEPRTLAIEHLGAPGDPSTHAAEQLAKAEGAARLVGDRLAPLFAFALAWLRRTAPTDVARSSLVHSDMGPGNFLAAGGRVTAVLDWEVAHWGDAMEDLAAVAVRDMATPVGHLPTRFAEYEAAGGGPVDLRRVEWYRVLVLARNAMMIGLGLRNDSAALDRVQLTMYRTLLMRACALTLCDAVGVPRPVEAPLAGTPPTDETRLAAHALRDLRETVLPTVTGSFAGARGAGAAAVLEYLGHALGTTPDYHARELDDLATVIGRRPDDEIDGFGAMRPAIDDPAREHELAAFFGRHLLRRGMLLAPLLGPLAERHPQQLDATA
jgi:aminoglycoside phosphotransferase (APT) family kinase protein